MSHRGILRSGTSKNNEWYLWNKCQKCCANKRELWRLYFEYEYARESPFIRKLAFGLQTQLVQITPGNKPGDGYEQMDATRKGRVLKEEAAEQLRVKAKIEPWIIWCDGFPQKPFSKVHVPLLRFVSPDGWNKTGFFTGLLRNSSPGRKTQWQNSKDRQWRETYAYTIDWKLGNSQLKRQFEFFLKTVEPKMLGRKTKQGKGNDKPDFYRLRLKWLGTIRLLHLNSLRKSREIVKTKGVDWFQNRNNIETARTKAKSAFDTLILVPPFSEEMLSWQEHGPEF